MKRSASKPKDFLIELDTTVVTRRRLLQSATGLAIGAIAAPIAALAQQAKWSTGLAKPKVPLPAGTVDCHHHIYDARFPADPKATLRPADALIADYRGLQERLGCSRNVIVQPSTYGVDNRLLLESLQTFGASARAIVVVVNDSVTNEELARMWPSLVVELLATLCPPVRDNSG